MKNRFVQMALIKLISEKKITYSEAMIYNFMRSHAFQKKKRRCTVDHKYISKLLCINANKVLSKINKLEKLKMVIPIYIVEARRQKIEFKTFKEAVDTFNLRAIKYKDYYIKDVPGQKQIEEEYKEKQKRTKLKESLDAF